MFNPIQFYESGRARKKIFEAIFDTTKTSAGSSSSNQIKLLFAGTSFDIKTIDWGDGIVEVYTTNIPNVTHIYTVSGVYNIKIISNQFRLSFGNNSDKLKLLEIKTWGGLYLYGSCFTDCSNLILSNVIDVPKMDTTSSGVFTRCSSITTINKLNEWDFSVLTSPIGFFSGCSKFNQPINLNTLNATSLASFLFNCSSFNSSITLNTDKVVNHTDFLRGATVFNNSITFSSYVMYSIVGFFRDAKAFNQTVAHWDTSNVNSLALVFYGASAYNQDVSTLDISNALSVNGLFFNATNFNQDISALNFNINTDTTNIMSGKTFNNYNKLFYNNLLQKWASAFIGTGRTNTNKNINMGTIRYTSAGKSYRDALVADGWNITDGGLTV
ncbi:DUF285 domain-containing protein [Kaistella sp. 97-N-M2]|uniref:DUF285 domain-containing protein n=1 Tax=Kaistella sp. 97-N-M2 TaxID=2908645 RepID=UPI001F3D48BB|nr:DUF285 domain-containing protein [Kaistella sp. 97-N-M2]UJF29882.1 DUF285 domain-containing protein [Kaistella sp. 97-N-M2]